MARAVEEAWSRLGGIDMLVNNAGIGMRTVNPCFLTEPLGFWEVPPEGFRAVLETNLTGYFLVAREITPRMLAAGHGRIVNISMSHSTMNRAGFVPDLFPGWCRGIVQDHGRGPATGTGITVTLPARGSHQDRNAAAGQVPEGLAVIEPAVMGLPITRPASEEATGTHDERIIAIEFSDWLRQFRSHRSGNSLR